MKLSKKIAKTKELLTKFRKDLIDLYESSSVEKMLEYTDESTKLFNKLLVDLDHIGVKNKTPIQIYIRKIMPKYCTFYDTNSIYIDMHTTATERLYEQTMEAVKHLINTKLVELKNTLDCRQDLIKKIHNEKNKKNIIEILKIISTIVTAISTSTILLVSLING